MYFYSLFIAIILAYYLFGYCQSEKLMYENVFNGDSLCEFYDPSFPKDLQKFYIRNTLYTHTEEIKGKNVTICFYLCPRKNILEDDVYSECSSENPIDSGFYFGDTFNYLITGTERQLQSVNGGQCNSTGYRNTLTIKFGCNEAYSLHQATECDWILEMKDYAGCKGSAYFTKDNIVVNLGSLKKLKTQRITDNNKIFYISFFKQSDECGHGISMCEVDANGGKPKYLSTETQEIEYIENTLTIKGYHGTSKSKISTTIQLKCNWTIDGVSNIQVLKSPSPKKYHFKMESSLACVKLPQNCLAKDIENNLIYNISGLNKENDGWKVLNYSDSGNIRVNVCGSLTFKSTTNVCKAQHSQVCLEETKNGITSYTNLGSIPTSLQVSGDKVTGMYIGGSVCAEDTSKSISTIIEFICDNEEKLPKFMSNESCTYQLKWETPAACPILFMESEEDNCKINNILDLSGIHTDIDKELTLTDSSHFRYNLCGSLTKSCNNKTDVSTCWIKNGIEYPVGYVNQKLVQINELLSLSLDGEKCGNSRYTTKINFDCNISAPAEGLPTILRMIDNCKFEIDIATPLACRRAKEVNCTINSDAGQINLTSLMKRDDDFEIRDPKNSNITYLLNICHPIINPLCRTDSAICMVNSGKPHVLQKYKEIGLLGSNHMLYNNETLQFNYTFGPPCTSISERYRSTIIFKCLTSSLEKEGPILVHRTNCFFEFEWVTKHACLIKSSNKAISHNEKIKNTTVNHIPSSEITTPAISKLIVHTFKPHIVKENVESNKNDVIVMPIQHKSTETTILPVTSRKPLNCIIKNRETNYEVNLNNIEPIKIETKNNNKYYIEFANNFSTCKGLICKNDQTIMPLTDVCPSVLFNYTKAMIKLSYISQDCKSNIWLQCNVTKHISGSILKDFNCFTEVVYPTKEACLLLEKVVASSAGVAIGSSVGLVVVLLTLAGGFVIWKKRYTNSFTRICYHRIEDKSSVVLYCKNTRD